MAGQTEPQWRVDSFNKAGVGSNRAVEAKL